MQGETLVAITQIGIAQLLQTSIATIVGATAAAVRRTLEPAGVAADL